MQKVADAISESLQGSKLLGVRLVCVWCTSPTVGGALEPVMGHAAKHYRGEPD